MVCERRELNMNIYDPRPIDLSISDIQAAFASVHQEKRSNYIIVSLMSIFVKQNKTFQFPITLPPQEDRSFRTIQTSERGYKCV